MRKLAALLLAAMMVTPVFAADMYESSRDAEWDYSPVNPGEPWQRPTALLFDNGPLVNCAGCGFGGADESQLQTVLGMNILGFGHAQAAGVVIADDFTVPAGDGSWTVDTATTFAYQTGSGPPSTITGVFIQFYDGMPGGGGSVIFGDLTTNVQASTAFSNIYRVTDTSSGATNRPLMAQTSNIGNVFAEGTYWMAWQSDGSGASGPWVPPITINGQTTTGDALQSLDNGATWGPADDSGTLTTQGIPFLLDGTVGGGTPTETVDWSSLKGTFAE